MFASVMLAREMPDLIESQLILSVRDVLPDRVTQARGVMSEAKMRQSWLNHFVFLHVNLTLLLFSTIPPVIQRFVVLYGVSGVAFIALMSLISVLGFSIYSIV